jgi:uncharacterized protein with FMN-binding domain
LVIGATGAGLGLLLSFHTKALHVSIASPAGASSGGAARGSGSSSTSSPASSDSPSTTAPSGGAPGSSSTGPTTPPTTAGTTRSATGQEVQYRYGDLKLEVTEKGSQITNIQILADDATDPRSAEINSQALPLLQQEAMSAQSANIDGVSGATFTSQAYADALQSALDQLKS